MKVNIRQLLRLLCGIFGSFGSDSGDAALSLEGD